MDRYSEKKIILQKIVVLISIAIFCGYITKIQANSGNNNSESSFDFPTTENKANINFTSVPDLFNWNIKYPQPGWEDAMDWFLGGMKKEGPDFMLNAGDVMDARWWNSKEQVLNMTNEWWGGFKKRFEDKDIEIYIAPGDHEYGDDQGLSKMDLNSVFAKQFVSIFNMPKNGPENMKGLAYSFTKGNVAVISVNTFENAGGHLSITVSGEQLRWLEEQLQKYQGKDFIIVQGHVPVLGPVASKSSSANMLEEGAESKFWKTMVKYGVDAYLCGEHHRITAKKYDGIWQIVHGALWGTHTRVNYLRGSVFDNSLKLELFRFSVEYSDAFIQADHPHRGPTNKPHKKVWVSNKTRAEGPKSVGELIIEKRENGNITTRATGEF